MKKNNYLAKASVFCLLFLVSIISCEIGLGSAVDTQPPSVSIDSPKVDAVIRDVFAITGRWSDDGSISDVKVTLKRTDGNGNEITIPGEWLVDEQLKETGTWKAIIDYEKENIIDGTYQATVSIKDKGKHETTQSTTFTIDNTAPVLVVSRPSIKDGQSGFDSYGRSFTLEGKASDDNDVSLIEVNVFENADSTTPMKTVELRNVPLTIEQDVAVYDAAEANAYSIIYGHTDENGIITEIGDTEKRYCTVRIYDSAERYPVDGSTQTEEDKKGNNTDVYYMNSEITSILQSGIKITDLYHMMNKTYTEDAGRSVTSQNVLTQLDSLKVTKGKFSINPSNNPKFIVSSLNDKDPNKTLDDVDYQFTAGNRYIEVEITPGLDGYPLDPDTIGVYLQECDENGTVLNPDNKIWLIKTGADYHKTQEEADAAGQSLENEVGIYSVSGSTYKFKTSKLIHKNNYDVKIGSFYLVKVDGNDSQGVESGKIIENGKYGFKLVSNEEKIELSVEGVPEYLPIEEDVWKDTDNPITFTATLSWEKGEVPFDVYRSNETKQFVKIQTVNSTAVNNKWQYVDEFDYDALTAIAATGETFPKQLNYILKNSSGDEISTTARITLKYDSEKPNISNVQISNSYEKKIKDANNQDKYVYYVRNEANNKCEISGTATDKNGIEKIILKIPGLNDVQKEGGDGHFTFSNIDFSSLSGSVVATILAYDNAGNSFEKKIEFRFDTTGPVATHEIDDKIKDLYFRIGSANNDDISKDTSFAKYGIKWNDDDQTNKIDEDVGSKYSNGAYGNDNTIQIRGNFTDAGSGVKKIYYQVRSTETQYTNENDLKALAKEIVEDTEHTKSFSLLESSETKRVFYNSIVTVSGNNVTYDGTVGGRITGTVTQLIQKDVTPNKPTKKFYKNVETNYKNSLSGFKEGSNYLILVAEDNVGNLSVDVVRNVPYKDGNGNDQIGTFVNYSLNVDTVVPDISTNSTDIIFTNQDGIIELSGKVNDEGAGLRSLDFYLNNDKLDVYSGEDDDNPPLIQGTQNIDYSNLAKCIVSITTTAGKSKGPNGEERYNDWNIIIPASLFTASDKTYTVYAVAKDNAGTGNEKKESVGTVKVDNNGPTVNITSPASGASVNKSIIISGNATDGNGAGIKASAEPKLYWTTLATAIASEPDPDDLADKADEGWVELELSSEQTPTALTAKTWLNSEWSYTIDTEKLKGDGTNVVTNGTTAYFTVCATDKSGTGNVDYATPHTLIVDQNSDRPIIKFSNLDITKRDSTDNKIWITKEDLYASVSDDDGEVTKFRISFDGTNWEEEDNQGNKYYTSENGLSYTIPTNKDGAQTVYFEVTDSKGTKFVSTVSTEEEDTVKAPKLAYKTTEISETVLNSKIDLKEPSIPCIYFTGEDYSSVTTETALNLLFNSNNTNLPADLTKWHDLTNIAEALGGSTEEIYILVKAKDENGIKSVSSTFAGNAVTAIISSNNTTENTMAALFKIDISSMGTTLVEKKRVDIKAIDNANHNHTSSIDIEIDNVAPVVDIDSPSANAELYGTAGVAQNNVTVRGRTSDASEVTKVYLAVTEGEDVEPAASGVSAYKDITKRSALSWTVVFNGSQTSSDDVYYTDLFNTYIDSLYGENTTTSETQKDLCLWLYAEDKLGNSGKANPKRLPLTILTQGDKPIVSITYPTKTTTVGGVITITGSTSIAINEVDKIFVQIDPNYDHKNPGYNILNNEFASDWQTSLQSIITAANTAGKTIEYAIEEIKYSDNEYVLDSEDNKIKGIVAGGSKQSWNVILNAASEFNTEGNRDIAVRAYAISKSKKISEPITTWFTLDPDSPTFGNNEPLTLVQYANNTAGTGLVKASKLYTPGMWIQGKWWLTGSVEDDAGIDYVKLDGTSLVIDDNLLSPTTDGQGNSKFKGYMLKIPVGKAIGTETVYGPTIKLVTKESGGEKTSTLDVKLYYDNIPPEFECTTLKTDSELGAGETNTLVQSDGVCEIKGTLKELGEQSGFKRIAFYVTRTSNGNNYITDVMKKQGTGLENCILLSGLTSDDDLYWKTVTGCTAKNSIEIEVPAASLPSFARSGGLCRINEVIYRIESITDGQNGKKIVTIDSKIDNGSVSVDFALAQVIDNKVSELGITTFFGDTSQEITNDDDDQMVESYKESSGEWTVSINSKNIYDGVIQIHFVAFDEAGNKTTQSYTASVANNAPRIAGVVFGTDTNGNGSFEESEKRFGYNGIYTVGHKNQKQNITVNGQAANGTKISKLALPNDGTDIKEIDNTKSSLMTVKGDMIVIPEIVGGNKGLSWTYSVDGVNKSTSATVLNNTHSADDDVRTDNTTIVLDTLTMLKNTTDKPTVLGFKIWDHTEGTTPGTNSNYAELLLKVNIALRDEEKPTAGIKPFYWNSIPVGDNNNSSIVYENGIAFGHIELENDFPQSGFDYAGTDGEEYDLDPKVSGVVYLEGFAKDNVVVEKLYLKFPGLTGFDDFAVVAHRDRTNSSTKGLLIKDTNLSDNGVEFVSADEEIVQEGDNEYNVVHWKLKIDTSKLAKSVATNILVQVKAEDRGAATLADSGSSYDYQNAKQSDIPAEFDIDKNQTGYSLDAAGSVEMSEGRPTYDSTNQTPSYRIDVVPYIAKVYTSLGALKKNNWSVYNRTALGHYPVASDGTIYIYGFNLGKDGYLPEYGTTSLAAPAAGSEQNANYPSGPKSDTNPESEYAAYSVVTLPVTSVTSSGKISLKVNSVETLNNINNDNARGSYTGSVDLEVYPTGDKTSYSTYYYNRQPNGDNNNLLTDDVELDVWEINSNVAQAQGSADITEPIMKINPVSGMLNFAFNSGPANFAMANGTTTSYTTWIGNIARMTTTGFTVDEKGVTHGITAGLDTNPSRGSAGRLQYINSKWGTCTARAPTQENYEGKQSSRFDTIGAPAGTYNGVTYSDWIFMEDRFASPSLATAIHKDESNVEHTYVFLAYYDGLNDQIRFRYGDLNDTITHNIGRSFGGFQDQSILGGKYVNGDDNSHISFDTNKRPQDFSVLAASGISGNYLSIDIIKGTSVDDDVIVATWQDSISEKWYYSYKKKPCTDNDLGSGSGDGYWRSPILLASNAGQDCHISVDPRGGVHLAAYDGSEANLLYAYFANYTDSTPQIVTVDSYAFTGEHLTLDTAISSDGNYVVPLIGYYMSSAKKPKIARLDKVISATNGSGTIPSGVDDNDACTGKWETAIIPTDSKYSDNYAYSHVNVGVWKDAAGKIKISTQPEEGTTDVNTWIGDNKKVSDETKGYFWGNGTDNPVLGYAIRVGTRGFIETAQMK